MGSNKNTLASSIEMPKHKVRITKTFGMSITPITQKQWIQITHSDGVLFNDSPAGEILPAEGIEWDNAVDYCRRLTAQLRQDGVLGINQIIDIPTEAQWEYACRAGTTSPWYFGEDADKLEDYGWYSVNSGGSKHPVALKKPNPWGIYDLYGNVAEWCRDDLYKYQDIEEIDPDHFNTEGLVKVTRGGDFSSQVRDCRSASRGSCNRDNPFNESTGMRIVCYEL